MLTMRFNDYNLLPPAPTLEELHQERRFEDCELLLDKVVSGEPVEGVTVDDVVDVLGYEEVADLVAIVLRGGKDFNVKLSSFRRRAVEKSLQLFDDFL
ncbi:hypothetical protein JYB87_12005 [Shewanella avicenniae]|uniref:Uncharacterized protein n=1 Tax=Shewanella avicenniae TaxID=2814294 RepID=A0ABX7QM17_9GAMM|nr:hypothetical protein [Shewanella avicenniae]QSX32489.1 hypothetical protein JYB87_12005 [Shewanella avicenniae]